MDENDWLAARFEEHRPHLRAVAHRMLGSQAEADDAVQEAWIRMNRSDTGQVENLGGWLTTVVARVSLNMLRSRSARREVSWDPALPEPVVRQEDGLHPEHEALLADSLGLALLVVLDTLAPAERLAFVLHDMFAVPFDEIAPIVGRTPTAARQLASRARRRVQAPAAEPVSEDADTLRRHLVVDAFLAASRGGDFEALLAVLDPRIVVHADAATAALGMKVELRDAASVADLFTTRARGAEAALVDGVLELVWAPEGQPRLLFNLTVVDGRIAAMTLIADPGRLAGRELVLLER